MSLFYYSLTFKWQKLIAVRILFKTYYVRLLKCITDVTLFRQNTSEHQSRVKEVLRTIEVTGTYDTTYDELVYGAKMAWRNAPRCIGRIQWNKLQVSISDVCENQGTLLQLLLITGF